MLGANNIVLQSLYMAQNKSIIGRIPPQDLEAEKAVLGSVMIRPGVMDEIVDLITPESFYASRHATVFETMVELWQKGQPIDLLSVSAKLKDKSKLESIGGSSFLAELSSVVPASVNARYYAQIVYSKSALRGLIAAAEEIAQMGFASERETDEILDEAQSLVYSVASTKSARRFTHLKDALHDAWERLEHMHEQKGALRGVATGFADIDNLLSGLQKSDLIILAARPGMGKTTLALDIARHASARENLPVLFCSLEMSMPQVVDRIMAAEARVHSQQMRTGRLSADTEFVKLRDALDRLAKAPLFIDDRAGSNTAQIRANARRIKTEHGLGLIIIDYLQLMATKRDYDSMVGQVTEISRALKALAKDLDVPVLALSQLSRAVESRGGKPRLSDLRESGSIEQDADIVMFIHSEDRDKDPAERTNIVDIVVEKHRNGPTGLIQLYFDKKTTTFLSVERSNISELVAPKESGVGEEF